MYTFDDLAEITQKVIKANKKVVTIAGPSASGKSYFAKRLAEDMRSHGYSVLEISSDDYYTNDTQLHAIVYGTFDHPNLIEYNKLNADLKQYLETGTMKIPQYSFVEKRTIDYKEINQPYDFIIVEGIYAIAEVDTHLPETTIFVSSPSEELLMRRFLRDQERTGEPWEQIIGKMDNMFPMWNVYGQKQENANIVIQNTFNILDDKGMEFEKMDPSSIGDDWEVTETIYAIDHIYLEQNEGLHDDIIILSENYNAHERIMLRSVTIKNVLLKHENNRDLQKFIHFRFYQPGIITSLHSLLQLAGMKVSHTTHVNKTYYSHNGSNYVHIKHLDKDEEELFKQVTIDYD